MLLRSVTGTYIACSAIAQPSKPRIPLRSLNSVSLIVSDLQRSLEFYRGLFGMPIQHRQGIAGVILKIGTGPQGLGLFSKHSTTTVGAASDVPEIARVCFTTDAFDPGNLSKALADYGVRPADRGGPGGPLRSWVQTRNEDRGGAEEGTPEVY